MDLTTHTDLGAEDRVRVIDYERYTIECKHCGDDGWSAVIRLPGTLRLLAGDAVVATVSEGENVLLERARSRIDGDIARTSLSL